MEIICRVFICSLVFKKIAAVATHCLAFQNLYDYYNKRGSKVYCPFLDASKAFDKVLIHGLLVKLIKRQVPLAFIRILVSWCCSLHCSVTWNSVVGVPFEIKCGVRQGGILSPLLFAVYMDDLMWLRIIHQHCLYWCFVVC